MSNDLVLLDARFKDDWQSYDNITDKGRAFEVFCADLVLRDYKLSYDNLIQGIVGGGLDGGIDGFYIFVNGQLMDDSGDLPDLKENILIRLVLFQVKHESKNEQSVVNNLHQHIDYVLDLKPDQNDLDLLFNSDLQQKMNLFRDIIKKYGTKQYELEILINYCNRATSEPNAAAIALSKKIEDKCTATFSTSRPKFLFFGASKLHALSIKPNSKTKEIAHLSGGIISADSECYVALVKLSDFLKFIRDEDQIDQNMFEFNVRDFAGDTKPVNQDISKTIQENEANTDFWWFNNGVTIIADEAKQVSNRIVMKNPMIVNGLQTANVVNRNGKFIAGNPSDNRSVLIRIVSVNDISVREGIIKATNSQTKLASLALKATDLFQRKIEEHLKNNNIYYERRTNYYKNRGKKVVSIIDISRLGQAVMAINLQVPHESRARPGTYLGKEGNYQKVFPDGANLNRFVVAASLERALNSFLQKNRNTYDAKYKNNLRFHTLMVLAWTALEKKGGDSESINLDIIGEDMIQKTFEWVLQEFDKFGGEDSDAKDSVFTDELKNNWVINFTKP